MTTAGGGGGKSSKTLSLEKRPSGGSPGSQAPRTRPRMESGVQLPGKCVLLALQLLEVAEAGPEWGPLSSGFLGRVLVHI